MHTIVGTPFYVAPEVLRANYGSACDIWSLGIILYVFLCGYPPFAGDDKKVIYKNILTQPLSFDPKEWESISDEAKDLVQHLLERDPARRFTAS